MQDRSAAPKRGQTVAPAIWLRAPRAVGSLEKSSPRGGPNNAPPPACIFKPRVERNDPKRISQSMVNYDAAVSNSPRLLARRDDYACGGLRAESYAGRP